MISRSTNGVATMKTYTMYRFLQIGQLSKIGVVDQSFIDNVYPGMRKTHINQPYLLDSAQKMIAVENEHPALIPHGGEIRLTYQLWTAMVHGTAEQIGRFTEMRAFLAGMVSEAPEECAHFELRYANWAEMLELLDMDF